MRILRKRVDLFGGMYVIGDDVFKDDFGFFLVVRRIRYFEYIYIVKYLVMLNKIIWNIYLNEDLYSWKGLKIREIVEK